MGVVKWNGSLSKVFDVTHGTRQGGVLSPYLLALVTMSYMGPQTLYQADWKSVPRVTLFDKVNEMSFLHEMVTLFS